MNQYDQYIEYGRVEHGGEFQRLPEMLKQIAYVYSWLAKTLFNEKSITTSIFRKKTNDSGIHSEYRAIDFKPLSKIEYTYQMLAIINSIFIYDPARPYFKVADENPFHGTGLHTHLQSHPNTTFLSDSMKLAFTEKAKHDESNFKPITLGVA